MSLNPIFKSETLRRNIYDWALALGLFVYFFLVAEHAKPFNRQFSLSDPTIQHPFADNERVSGIECLLLASVIPLTIIGVCSSYLKAKHQKSQAEHFHLLQITILGLLLALSIDGVITDIFKNWIARPRPDFLARCGPKKGTPLNTLVGIEVCTAPLGERLLIDGMRSTPSGHASISFSGLLYVTLWLCGQFKVVQVKAPVYKLLLCILPVLCAFYISLSRTQDYRHHFSDIVLGGSLGSVIAVGIYHKFFPRIFSNNSDKPLLSEEIETVLPVYNSVSQLS